MKKLFITLIFSSIIFSQTDGEVVKNVRASQRTDGSKIIDIYYDLDSHDIYSVYDITVTIEWPDAQHTFILTNCAGDIWYNVRPDADIINNDKHIYCQLQSETDSEYLSGDFYINVLAESTAATDIPDTFEFVAIDVDNEIYPTALIDNNYELMKYEVTAAQYVEFLNELLGSAVSVVNNDHDGWSDIEGGETYNRIYTLENGERIHVYYANRGGTDTYGAPIDNDAKGWGVIYGSFDVLPNEQGFLTESNTNLMQVQEADTSPWLRLDEISTDDTFPHIQFNGGNAGSESYSFFISEGKGDHPITGVTFYGADAFADYYGLRIPTTTELIYPHYPLLMLNDLTLFDCNNYMMGTCFANHHPSEFFSNGTDYECNSYNFSCDYNTTGGGAYEIQCEDQDPDFISCSTFPVGRFATTPFDYWYEIYDLFGNISEIAIHLLEDYSVDGNHYLTSYNTVLIGGGYDNTELFQIQNYWDSPIYYPSSYSRAGFRCVRDIINQ